MMRKDQGQSSAVNQDNASGKLILKQILLSIYFALDIAN
jgi:hypothetical protein